MKKYENLKNYYIGLDIGSDSIGYAVTNEQYSLLKHKGEAMWGTHLFEGANINDERRAFRSGRRRLDRKQMRVELIRQLFSKEIEKVDKDFFKRQKLSALCLNDKVLPTKNILFNDDDFCDKDYYLKYPTIHHLMKDLIESDQPKDIRLVCIAVCYLVAHRGHFLNEVDKDNIEAVLDFSVVYDNF